MTSRRDFLSTAAAASAATLLPRAAGADSLSAERGAALQGATRARPVVVASSNGLRGVKVAYDQIVKGDRKSVV